LTTYFTKEKRAMEGKELRNLPTYGISVGMIGIIVSNVISMLVQIIHGKWILLETTGLATALLLVSLVGATRAKLLVERRQWKKTFWITLVILAILAAPGAVILIRYNLWPTTLIAAVFIALPFIAGAGGAHMLFREQRPSRTG
jgi:hypothetical protein